MTIVTADSADVTADTECVTADGWFACIAAFFQGTWALTSDVVYNYTVSAVTSVCSLAQSLYEYSVSEVITINYGVSNTPQYQYNMDEMVYEYTATETT